MAVELPPELEAEIETLAKLAHLSKDEWVRESLTKSVRDQRLSAVERMSRLNAPTCDIDQMLAEIEAGRLEYYRSLEDLP